MNKSKGQIQVELQETMGSDRAIANSAWTSSLDYEKKQSRTEEDTARIVNMLADSKHSVPFESVVFRFWISMPIQTDRQHMTHRIASSSGMSGRYRTMPDEWLDIPQDIIAILSKEGIDKQFAQEICGNYHQLCSVANSWYRNVLIKLKEYEKSEAITNTEYKRCRELFRGVLPQNNMTERVTIINLRSFANYQKLRNKPEAQPEIQLVAQLMLEAVKQSGVCPIALEALERNGWNI